MSDTRTPAELAALVDTLIEGQALLVSSIYIDLINLGLLEPETAAARLRALAGVAKSPLQRHPEAAARLAGRIQAYADGVASSGATAGSHEVKLRLIAGGKSD